MIPYSNFFFFYILAFLLLPAIFLGIFEKNRKHYGFFASILMLFLIFHKMGIQPYFLIGFYAVQLFTIMVYSRIRANSKNSRMLWIFVLLSLSPLLAAKSGSILLDKQIGFLGISYLTFKALQMLLEIHDGLVKKISIYDFTYFLLFFPTISSGPIDRSRRFLKDIDKPLSRAEYADLLMKALDKVFKGILYKFVIAFLIHDYWLMKIPVVHHTFLSTMNYMYAYSMYLFFDFAGYSLIAIGISYVFGIKTPENFNMPFLSQDMKDFWNRWHMSLSFWFRDFIYTRFVMTAIKKKWFKSKYTASYIGYGITMGLMGIWHGVQLYYIMYGFYQALLIILTDVFQRGALYKRIKGKRSYRIASIVITFHFICFGFLIFSGYL